MKHIRDYYYLFQFFSQQDWSLKFLIFTWETFNGNLEFVSLLMLCYTITILILCCLKFRYLKQQRGRHFGSVFCRIRKKVCWGLEIGCTLKIWTNGVSSAFTRRQSRLKNILRESYLFKRWSRRAAYNGDRLEVLSSNWRFAVSRSWNKIQAQSHRQWIANLTLIIPDI
jgi:hypothetical protein